MSLEVGLSLPVVSVIIVNWNGKEFLKKNLSSIFNQSYRAFEVIFVDNGSADGSADFVKADFPEVIIIENKKNLGFAAANNQGIDVAKGKYILTLNNDTEMKKGFLEEIVSKAKNSPENVGMWAPKILSVLEPERIDSVGGLLIYRDGIARGRGRLEEDKGQYERSEEVLFPSACSALYLKEMLDQIGCFDDDFFAYCEDTDLGLRARLSGWKAVSVPSAVVYHYYSGSTGRYSEMKAFLVERNHLWVTFKNLPISMCISMPFYIIRRWLVQLINVLSGEGATSRYVREVSAFKILAVLLKSCFSALWGIPGMLRKRRNVMKRKVASNKEVRQWFMKYGLTARAVVKD